MIMRGNMFMGKKNKKKPKVLNIMIQIAAHCGKKKEKKKAMLYVRK